MVTAMVGSHGMGVWAGADDDVRMLSSLYAEMDPSCVAKAVSMRPVVK